jgi:cell division initiation protein
VSVVGYRGGNAASPPESTERSEASEAAPASEHDELRRRIEQLEAEVERYRSQEQLLSKALLAATAHASQIREAARREAEAALKKASAKAHGRVVGAETERREAEREIVRLRKLADEMRAGLSVFLETTLSHLQVEEPREEAPEKAAAVADAVSSSSPEAEPRRGGIEYRAGTEPDPTPANPEGKYRHT